MKCSFKHLLVLTAILTIAINTSANDWDLRIVDNAGDMGYCSQIDITSDGIPCILYVSHDNKVYLAWWVPSGPGSGGWQRKYIGHGNNYFRSVSLFIDSNDEVHITWSYSFNYYCYLYYALFNIKSETWSFPPETVIMNTYYDEYYPAICAVEKAGAVEPLIVYMYDEYDHLYCATRDSLSGTWSIKSIYTTGTVGEQISIDVSSIGRIYTSFYEKDGKDLMYATRAPNDTLWAIGYIDITGDVGYYNSIVIDENDIPHVVYYDATNGDLKYAKVIAP